MTPSNLENITISGNVSLTVSPPVIDGDIRYWIKLMNQMAMYRSRMRVKAMPDGGVVMEFYSPWDFGEPESKPEMAKVVKKPWWRIW